MPTNIERSRHACLVIRAIVKMIISRVDVCADGRWVCNDQNHTLPEFRAAGDWCAEGFFHCPCGGNLAIEALLNINCLYANDPEQGFVAYAGAKHIVLPYISRSNCTTLHLHCAA